MRATISPIRPQIWTVVLAALGAVFACNDGGPDNVVDTDLLCGASVAWYAANSGDTSNPNNPNASNPASATDPNSTASTQVVCCATTSLVTLQSQGGGTYACCPLPLSTGPSSDPSASCCPSNLLQDFAPDAYYYDYGYGYYYY